MIAISTKRPPGRPCKSSLGPMTIGTYIRWHPDTYARLALAATRSRQSIGDYCRTVISRSLRF